MKTAYINNGKLCIEYDRTLTSAITTYNIKQISGHIWNPVYLRWEIPLTQNNIKKVKDMGFEITDIDNDIKDVKEDILKTFPFLYDFQVDCVARGVITERLLIADDCGLGKTIQSLAISIYLHKNEHIKHIIICCPKSIKKQWKISVSDFFGEECTIVEGPLYMRKKIYINPPKILIINYEQILADFMLLLPIIKNNILIYDEMSYLKNRKAKRTKLSKQFAPSHLYGLTGTPIENKLEDAFNICNIINPEWMTKSEFWKYCVFEDHRIVGYKNLDKFQERFMECTIRRKMSDVKVPPELIIYERFVELSKEQIKLERIIIDDLRKGKRQIQDFTFLHMVCDSTLLIKTSIAKSIEDINKDLITESSPKLDELLLILNELNDEKIVIFTKYAKMAHIILEKLPNSIIATGESKRDKTDIKEDFRKNYKYLVTTDTMAYGVDMPFVDTIINFDIPWNPAKIRQRVYRAYRLLRDRPLKVFNIISAGIESHIYDAMCGKRCLSEEILNVDIKKHILQYIH